MPPVSSVVSRFGMPRTPKVTVFIPVYNREHQVRCAIDSILAQTYDDFDLLLLDDGSTDSTLAVLQSYDDPRIRVERNEVNLGLPRTRNRGLDLARGEYFAILDSDDCACPERLRKQVAYLDQHPDVAVVGAFAGTMREDGRPLRPIKRRPVAPEDVDAALLFRCSLQNSASTARTAILRHHRYREEFDLSEDFDLWARIAAEHKLANLPEVLVRYRVHGGRTTRGRTERIQERQIAIFRYQLERLGVAFSEEDLRRHNALPRMKKSGIRPDLDYLDWAEEWLARLQAANRRSRRYSEPALTRLLGWMWLLACAQTASRHRWSAARRFWRSPLRALTWAGLRSSAARRLAPRNPA